MAQGPHWGPLCFLLAVVVLGQPRHGGGWGGELRLVALHQVACASCAFIGTWFPFRSSFIPSMVARCLDHRLEYFIPPGWERVVVWPSLGSYAWGPRDPPLESLESIFHWSHCCFPASTSNLNKASHSTGIQYFVITYMCVRVCVCVCVCVYICVYIHIYKYIHIYMSIYIHMHTRIHIHVYIHTYIHTHIRTYIHEYIHTHAYTHTYTYTYTHTCIYTHIHIDIYTCMYAYTCIHIYTRIYIHIHICICTYTYTHTSYIFCYIYKTVIFSCMYIYIHIKQNHCIPETSTTL